MVVLPILNGNDKTNSVFAGKNIYYPISRSEIATNKNINNNECAYLLESTENTYLKSSTESNEVEKVTENILQYVKDEEGYTKTFINVLSNSTKYWDKGEYLLWNLPNATYFTIEGNWVGAILAPNATGTDNHTKVLRNGREVAWCNGHLAGNLICKSYSGYQEFGTTLFTMPTNYLNLKEVEINKIDISTKENLVGATMKIKTTDGTTLYQWKTTENPETLQLAEGEYILEEVSSIKGYKVAEPIGFNVDKNGNIQLLSFKYQDLETEEITSLYTTTEGATQFIKQQSEKGIKINKISYLPDTSQAINNTEVPLDTMVANYTLGNIQALKYTTNVENQNITTYIPITTDFDWEISFFRSNENQTATEVNDITIKTITVYYDEIVNKKTALDNFDNVSVKNNTLNYGNSPKNGIILDITKIDKDTKLVIPGVEFGLYSADDNEMFAKDEEIISGITNANGQIHLEKYVIPDGTYYLKEISVPTGYIISNQKYEFEVKEEIIEKELTIENAVTKLEITKTDMEENLVIGAILQLRDDEENEIATWTTTEDAYYAEKLPMGNYTLVEVNVPNGYSTAENIEFTLDANTEITKIEMKEAKTNITVKKLDDAGNPIEGALLQILDKDGNEITTWTTTTEPHEIIGTLIVGETYTLVEVEASKGYEKAESTTFEVKDTSEAQLIEIIGNVTKTQDTPNEGEIKIEQNNSESNELQKNSTMISSDSDNSSNSKGSGSTAIKNIIETVATGDTIYIVVIVLICALIVIIGTIIYLRKTKEKTSKNNK